MTTILKRQLITLQIFAALIIMVASCNSKATESESEIVVTSSTVAIRTFSISPDKKVIENLDSVYFAIDLKTGVIFNADSLPKGTDVSKLVPVITFVNNMTKAEIIFENEDSEIVTTDYLTSPGDSIDFSKPVQLEVTAADGTSAFSYLIKVNVHEQEPDSLVWNRLEKSVLPSRNPNPVAQKTVMQDDLVYCLVEESDGTYTLSTSSDLNESVWEISEFTPVFVPDIETLVATTQDFYILDDTGQLYVSPDLVNWSHTGEKWINIIGSYDDSILGISENNGEFFHSRFPAPEGYVPQPLASGFPLFNYSSLGVMESKWADNDTAILTGGVTEDGTISNAVWGYDGNNWAVINSKSLPALEAPMMCRYVVFRETNYAFKVREFDVWLLFGGYTEENKMNRNVYISYDNGVNWQLAPAMMQLSQKVPYLGGANVVVAYYELTADLAEAWSPVDDTKTRVSYTIDGYDITWQCPYLFIFGGYSPYPSTSLNTFIYRGVLQRLEFTPLI